MPYFLTASHCIATEAEAASMELYWFYEKDSCGGMNRKPQRQRGGATLLARDSALETDLALVRLNRDPPPGVGLSGWTSAEVSEGDAVVDVHHAEGLAKKLTHGTVLKKGGKIFRIAITRGAVAGNASGSGLWTRVAGRDYLVGVLSGGRACTADYGRLDRFYPLIRQWIGAEAEVAAPEDSIPSTFLGLALVDEADGSTLMQVTDGARIDAAAMESHPYNFRANFTPGVPPRSVHFELSGARAASRTSNHAPHNLYGDGAADRLGPGTYLLSADVYEDPDRRGTALSSHSVSFTVSPPSVLIAAAVPSVAEGSPAVFSLTRTGPTNATLEVPLSVSETGAVLAGSEPALAMFAIGSSAAQVSLATANDEVVESPSTITATVTAGTGNAVEDLGALSDLAGLRRLDLRGNPVGDLRPLRALPSLVWVYVGGSRIEDLAPLDGLPGLIVAARDDRESRASPARVAGERASNDRALADQLSDGATTGSGRPLTLAPHGWLKPPLRNAARKSRIPFPLGWTKGVNAHLCTPARRPNSFTLGRKASQPTSPQSPHTRVPSVPQQRAH